MLLKKTDQLAYSYKNCEIDFELRFSPEITPLKMIAQCKQMEKSKHLKMHWNGIKVFLEKKVYFFPLESYVFRYRTAYVNFMGLKFGGPRLVTRTMVHLYHRSLWMNVYIIWYIWPETHTALRWSFCSFPGARRPSFWL